MQKHLPLILFVAVIILSETAFTQASSLNEAIETTGSGKINWTTSEIMATGIGAPSSMQMNPSQARAMTERAAYVVALRNLLETIKGVRVDSETVVENFMVKSDVIRTRVEGIIQGARVVKKQYMSDGSVEIQVAMPMKGAFLDAIVPETFGRPLISQMPMKTAPMLQKPSKPAEPEKKPEPVPPIPTTVPEKKPEPAPAISGPDTGSSMSFKGGVATGVVLDGRGLGLRPALLPRIIDPQGQEIYVGQIVTRTNAVDQGVAGYAKDVNAAANNFRVTDNPAVIKGIRSSGTARTDIVVSQADAQMLRQLSSKGDFLQYCRVIIVY